MKSAIALFWVILAFPTMGSADSMLWLQWQGSGPDAREIALTPGETAVIEIYFRRDPQSPDLEGLGFRNEPALALEQIDTEVLRGAWEDLSVGGSLGDGSQRVDFREPEYCGGAGCPPHAFDLYGSQTIRLNSVGDGDPLDITFDLGSVQILGFHGFPYGYRASSSPFQGANTYHIGTGSPGYEDGDGYMDERDPLIVTPVPEPSTLLVLGFAAAMLGCRHRGYYRRWRAA